MIHCEPSLIYTKWSSWLPQSHFSWLPRCLLLRVMKNAQQSSCAGDEMSSKFLKFFHRWAFKLCQNPNNDSNSSGLCAVGKLSDASIIRLTAVWSSSYTQLRHEKTPKYRLCLQFNTLCTAQLANNAVDDVDRKVVDFFFFLTLTVSLWCEIAEIRRLKFSIETPIKREAEERKNEAKNQFTDDNRH